jgi:glycosyltransferase
LASGDVVGILHSDDVFSNEFVISGVMSQFEIFDVDMVYGDISYVNEDMSKTIRRWKSNQMRESDIFYGWMPAHTSTFIRKSAYDKYGLYNTDFKIAADYELLIRYIYKFKVNIKYLPIELVKMRVGGLSNGSIKNRLLTLKEDYKALADKNNKLFTVIMKKLRKLEQYLTM